MLTELHVKNVAVIDEARVEFGGGFCALTGETGAGKSILIDSINMVLGGRTSRDLVRTGESKAVVNAVFDVSANQKARELIAEMGVDIEDDTIIISRELTSDGKSVCRINGGTVPLNVVRQAGELLINIHGQHDNQTLLTPKMHIEFVDEYGGLLGLKSEYKAVYDKVNASERQIKEISSNDMERAQRMDLLRFQIDEIESAKLEVGEEERLNEREEFLRNIEKIASNVQSAYTGLYGGDEGFSSAYDILSDAVRSLSNIQEYDEKLRGYHDALNSIFIELGEVAHDIGSYVNTVEFDPREMEDVQNRINVIYTLKRKYGSSVEEILEYYDKICQEVETIENSDAILGELKNELDVLKKERARLAQELSDKRKRTAKELESKITQELMDLDMKKVQFGVDIASVINSDGGMEYFANGQDDVEFMISTNAGEELKPLNKIASGGELSRVMLAIKSILAGTDSVDTLIFDEIDTGVSGRAAQRIAEKICAIAKNKLVLCITHLAQIAGMADVHYIVEKTMDESQTRTNVRMLDYDGRKKELARIIGGVTVTELTLSNAEEMLTMAKEQKGG